jgi:hypothetical protein
MSWDGGSLNTCISSPWTNSISLGESYLNLVSEFCKFNFCMFNCFGVWSLPVGGHVEIVSLYGLVGVTSKPVLSNLVDLWCLSDSLFAESKPNISEDKASDRA